MQYLKASTLKSAAAGLALAALAGQAQAATFVDTYIGGTNPSGWVGQDVVGDARFNITSMDVTRDGDGLKVVVNTNYSGKNVGAGDTTLGDLFLGQLANLSPTAFSNNLDTYVGDEDRFSHVFDFDTAPDVGGPGFNTNDAPASQGGGATLYTLLDGDNAGDDVLLSQDVEGSSGIRQNQPVDITDDAKKVAATPLLGTWSTVAGSVTFNIVDFFTAGGLGAAGGLYATGLTLGWGMTCTNDFILAKVFFTSNGIPSNTVVPIPAGLILLLSGLTGLGFLGRVKAGASKVKP